MTTTTTESAEITFAKLGREDEPHIITITTTISATVGGVVIASPIVNLPVTAEEWDELSGTDAERLDSLLQWEDTEHDRGITTRTI